MNYFDLSRRGSILLNESVSLNPVARQDLMERIDTWIKDYNNQVRSLPENQAKAMEFLLTELLKKFLDLQKLLTKD